MQMCLRQGPHCCRGARMTTLTLAGPGMSLNCISIPASHGQIADDRTGEDQLSGIARGRIPTAAWSIPVAAQNRITRSCASSFVVAFAMGHRPCSRSVWLLAALDGVSRFYGFGRILRAWPPSRERLHIWRLRWPYAAFIWLFTEHAGRQAGEQTWRCFPPGWNKRFASSARS